jgi:stage II sporulation protein D
VTAVNAVDLDDYLQGVVPGEVPTSWPAHALRAQAVAARSYAVAGGSRGGSIFDVYPDTRSQVYRGVSSEHPRTSAAVRATAGKVVSYKGKVITAFFFSTSGGRTEDNENIFGGTPQPYLRSVNDPYDNAGPRHRWSLTFTRAQLKARLGSLVKGDFQRIEVLRRGSSPRVLDAVVVGTQGRTQTKGTVLRTRLGLYDTWAYFTSIQTAARTTAAPAAALARARPVRADGILRVVLRATVSLRKEARRPVRRLSGSIRPTRAARRLRVERLEGRRRRTVARGRTNADGAYRVELRRPGRYRVRANGIVGPVVRVR